MKYKYFLLIFCALLSLSLTGNCWISVAPSASALAPPDTSQEFPKPNIPAPISLQKALQWHNQQLLALIEFLSINSNRFIPSGPRSHRGYHVTNDLIDKLQLAAEDHLVANRLSFHSPIGSPDYIATFISPFNTDDSVVIGNFIQLFKINLSQILLSELVEMPDDLSPKLRKPRALDLSLALIERKKILHLLRWIYALDLIVTEIHDLPENSLNRPFEAFLKQFILKEIDNVDPIIPNSDPIISNSDPIIPNLYFHDFYDSEEIQLLKRDYQNHVNHLNKMKKIRDKFDQVANRIKGICALFLKRPSEK